MDRDVGDFRDLADWVERTSLLRPKSGRNPTSAAKGSIWPVSCEVSLPHNSSAKSIVPNGPWVTDRFDYLN